jgi:hypothetical protein
VPHAAVLESEAFGPYAPPEYKEALRQVDNANPLAKGEVLHHECAPLPGAPAEPLNPSQKSKEKRLPCSR